MRLFSTVVFPPMSLVLLPVALLVVIGAVVLGLSLAWRTKGSRVLMGVLLGLLVLVLITGVVVLALKPWRVTLSVTSSTPGRAFVGRVEVDGVTQEVEGTTPATLQFFARRIEYAVIPVKIDPSETLDVRCEGVSASSILGTAGGAESRFGVFQYHARAVQQSEWDELAAELKGESIEDSTADTEAE